MRASLEMIEGQQDGCAMGNQAPGNSGERKIFGKLVKEIMVATRGSAASDCAERARWADRMKRHRIILGWLFFGMAMLLAVALVFAMRGHFGDPASLFIHRIINLTALLATLFALAGLSLLLDWRRAHWLCLPFALLLLFSFPLGTALGGYYLWYFWQSRRQRGATTVR